MALMENSSPPPLSEAEWLIEHGLSVVLTGHLQTVYLRLVSSWEVMRI